MITIIITTVYSRDLRYKEMVMMESMMKLPDDMIRQEILQYLTVDDIVQLDNACMNHNYRSQLMEKISGVILRGEKNQSKKASLFKWLGMRRIYWIKMHFDFKDGNSFASSIENDYVDQFRYTKHIIMRGAIKDDMGIFIISHCPCLLSIEFSRMHKYFSPSPQITDHTLQSIAEHCTGLQSLSLNSCWEITHAGLTTISEHCANLESLNLFDCDQITDDSIISISIHCIGLQSLNLRKCHKITYASIISIYTNFTGLQSLNLADCRQIADASIISLSTHCTELKSLDLNGCPQITDASIISLCTHCTGLQSLNLADCHQVTDASIISISENCAKLLELDISCTAITDASLKAIAKNCTGLQYLITIGCDGLSNEKLRYYFKSVSELRNGLSSRGLSPHEFKLLSELRAVLLSIYPSLPI